MPVAADENRDAARFAVAPMMDWTDRHCRKFHRLLTQKSQLFSEMVTCQAVIHGDRKRLIGFDPAEQPVVLQLGGSDPEQMAEAAKIGADWGYSEININVGCPSDRVQSGCFGAALMREPELVSRLVQAMKRATNIPITVKCRIGVDEQDTELALDELADGVFSAGCDALWVHARKAWLKGLSPKENRDVPPLDYDRVYRLKARLPDQWIGINGGIVSVEAARAHLDHVDGVMLGRAAYQSPQILADVDHLIFGMEQRSLDLYKVRDELIAQAEQIVANGGQVRYLSRHLVGFFQGIPGARLFRRHLSEHAIRDGARPDVIAEAFNHCLVGSYSEAQPSVLEALAV